MNPQKYALSYVIPAEVRRSFALFNEDLMTRSQVVFAFPGHGPSLASLLLTPWTLARIAIVRD